MVVRNPLGEDTSVMRTSMVPSHVEFPVREPEPGESTRASCLNWPRCSSRKKRGIARGRQTLCLGLCRGRYRFLWARDACACLLNPFGIEVDTVSGATLTIIGQESIADSRGKRIGQLGEIHRYGRGI